MTAEQKKRVALTAVKEENASKIEAGPPDKH